MKNWVNKLILTILLIVLTGTINKTLSQNFYADYVQYLESRSHPDEHLSKSKIHSIDKHFASEFKTLFKEVKRKTGFSMLDSDSLYIFKQENSSDGHYSCLIWNKIHSCYFENPQFSPFHNFKQVMIEKKTDAGIELSSLGPALKNIVEHVDTTGYKKYMETFLNPDYTIAKFVVAVRIKKRWYFHSSIPYATQKPD